MRLPRGLPELRGRWLAAYKVLWWAMLAITVIAVTAGQWRHAQITTALDMQLFGAGVRPDDDGQQLTFSPLSPGAEVVGIAPGSVLLAIDGRPVSSELSDSNLGTIAQALDGPDG